ncbi:MAG: ATP-binding protein [Isosphaeraceae bacterium]
MDEPSRADGDGGLERRVLLLAPTRRDSKAAVRLFASVGIHLTPCDDLAEVCEQIRRGAAAAIVPDEAILAERDGHLARALGDQPPWSDFPLIVLTSPHRSIAAARYLEAIGHMTLVHRPVEVQALASTIRAAIRDRERQYAIRSALLAHEAQAKALREADRRKDEFLAMLAHELRNPLGAVRNAMAVLKRSTDEADRAWAGEAVAHQVQQLARLIDDLLDVSRINSGKIRLRRAYSDAGPILDQAIASVRPLIDQKHHALHVAIDRGQLPLFADVTRVEQIVLNLLTNAAKYTEDGGQIWLSATRDASEAVIRVRDDGIGIPPEKLPEMFGLFSQGDRSLARSEGGLGIGLTLVRKLTEMHGGRVDASSEGYGLGSEFTVRLPLAPSHRVGPVPRPVSGPVADRPPEGEGQPPTPARRSRILVVDDNADAARSLALLLELIGHEARFVHDGPAAIEAAREYRPEFVLLDIGLPGLDGYQVAAALRRDESHRDAVIVAISGYGQDEARRRAKAAGFDHHLVKPLDFDALIHLIDQPR